jgi:hypothetical protein
VLLYLESTQTGEKCMAKVKWEILSAIDDVMSTYRTKVLGGWLVFVADSDHASGLTFVPDPKHHWDGSSFEPGEIAIED